MGMVDGLKKLTQLYDSPYNGLNFCLGCVAESLENPAEEVYDVIRWSASARRSSTCTSATSRAGSATSSRSSPTRGTSTC